VPGVSDAALTYATAKLDVVLSEGQDRDEAVKQILAAVRAGGEDLKLDEEEIKRLGAERSWFDKRMR
jgi:hypothetical protein